MSSATLDLKTLLKKSTIEDHESVLKACNVALKQSKNDLEAQHVKVIALLKLERCEDALRALDAGGDRLRQMAKLEHAYALYRTGSLEEAIALAKTSEGDRGARHVEAQASYRIENFSDAAETYESLAEAHAAQLDEESDLRINSGATDAQLEWQKQGNIVSKKKPTREDLEVFETAYNAACAAIARGDLGQSDILLERAKALCSALDELSDQQKLEESLPISVQQVYVLSRMGRHEEAKQLASGIHLPDISDLSTRQIGQNNQISCAPSTSNPFLAHRLFHDVPPLPKSDQLYKYQEELIHENELALDLLVGKPSAVVEATLEKSSSKPHGTASHPNKFSVLHSAAHAQSQLGKTGLKKILPLIEKRPTDVGLALTIIQLYILTSNHGSALTVMESLMNRLSPSSDSTVQDVQFAPGLVSILVSLYAHQNRKSQVTSVLAKAASYWRHKQEASPALLRNAGINLLDSPELEDQSLACDIFSTLRDSEPSSQSNIAGFVAAHAIASPKEIATEASSLTPIQRLIADVDVLALENAGVPPFAAADELTAKRKHALDEKFKPPKKRARKSRLPKDYEANKAPDPERWLPLRDRSSYRPKGKRGKKKAEALTQGGITDPSKDVVKGGGEGVIQAKSGGGGGKKKKGKK